MGMQPIVVNVQINSPGAEPPRQGGFSAMPAAEQRAPAAGQPLRLVTAEDFEEYQGNQAENRHQGADTRIAYPGGAHLAGDRSALGLADYPPPPPRADYAGYSGGYLPQERADYAPMPIHRPPGRDGTDALPIRKPSGRRIEPPRPPEPEPTAPPAAAPPEDYAAASAALAAAYRDLSLSPDQAARYAAAPLRLFADEIWFPERARQLQAGKVKRGTVSKDNQACNRWDRFAPRPEAWPAGEAWQGPALADVSDRYVAEFVTRLKAAGYSPATVGSTCGHLRTIFGEAAKLGAITRAPEFAPGTIPEQLSNAYNLQQQGAIYDAIARLDAPGDYLRQLTAAYVLAICGGPRTSDLFRLCWRDLRRQETDAGELLFAYFESMKTGKLQGLPLPPACAAHLAWIEPLAANVPGRPLFPDLSSPGSKEPTKTTRVRKATAYIKQAIAAAGLPPVEKPWQAFRQTCTSDLNNTRHGAGTFMLGHEKTLNARNYHDASPLILEAVVARRLPPQFLAILNS